MSREGRDRQEGSGKGGMTARRRKERDRQQGGGKGGIDT